MINGHPFTIQTQQRAYKGNTLQCKTNTAYITSEIRNEMRGPLSPLLLDLILKVLVRNQVRKRKGIRFGKE